MADYDDQITKVPKPSVLGDIVAKTSMSSTVIPKMVTPVATIIVKPIGLGLTTEDVVYILTESSVSIFIEGSL